MFTTGDKYSTEIEGRKSNNGDRYILEISSFREGGNSQKARRSMTEEEVRELRNDLNNFLDQ